MTRQDVLKEYRIEVQTGRIMNPGKFEGEMLYAPYFYVVLLESGDLDDTLEISDEDRHEFPELGKAQWVNVQEDDNGFVYCSLQ